VQGMKALFSAYRLDQYSDPEGFYVNIGLVLEQYPIDTIRFVTDPRTGIQRTHEWPPSVANVVPACESHVANVAKQARFRNWGKSETLIIEARATKGPLREHIKTLPVGSRWTMKEVADDWRTKHGVDLGLSKGRADAIDPKPAPTWYAIVDHYQNNPSEMERLTGALMTRNAK
jgi:hypothetical protein